MRHVSVISGHPISIDFCGLTGYQQNPWDRGIIVTRLQIVLLANIALDLPASEVRVWQTPPRSLSDILQQDTMGGRLQRVVPCNF